MSKLSDTQLVILSAAIQRPDRLVLPLPDRLKGGAATAVVESLTAKGLIEEVEAKRGEPVWRETGDGHGVSLVATDAAFAALGIEADLAPTTDVGASDPAPAPVDAVEPEPAPDASAPAPVRETRDGSKQALLIDMLKRPEGATTEQISAATGWQKHTVRGAIAGALKKKLGLQVTAEHVRMVGPNHEGAPGSYTVYRIASEPSA